MTVVEKEEEVAARSGREAMEAARRVWSIDFADTR